MISYPQLTTFQRLSFPQGTMPSSPAPALSPVADEPLAAETPTTPPVTSQASEPAAAEDEGGATPAAVTVPSTTYSGSPAFKLAVSSPALKAVLADIEALVTWKDAARSGLVAGGGAAAIAAAYLSPAFMPAR